MMTSRHDNVEADCGWVCESGTAWWQALVGQSKEQRTLQESQIPKDGHTCLGHRLVEEVRDIRFLLPNLSWKSEI